MDAAANTTSARVPEGYVAIPLAESAQSGTLCVCVLVRVPAASAPADVVVLRHTLDARVLLGCLADARGAVRQWLEVWVQDPGGFAQVAIACREAVSNAILDRRWQVQARMLSQLDPPGLLHTGWEDSNPPPLYLDVAAKRCVHLRRESGEPWALCRDGELLARKSLGDYAATLRRYLYVPALGEASPLVPVLDSPASDKTVALDEAIPQAASLLPLNPWAGLMLVRPLAPLGLEEFLAVLHGHHWPGISDGPRPLQLGQPWDSLVGAGPAGAAAEDGWLFLGRHGRSGRVVETLHLKLRLLLQAVEAVARAEQALRRPLLNLSPDSFRVDLQPPSPGLPFLWTARLDLVDPGDAVALPIPATDMEYYLPARADVSVYRGASGVTISGRAAVRIRQVLAEAGGLTVVEGTLASQERLEGGRKDLVWLRVSVGGSRLDLYARLEADKALAGGEYRFRTLGQRLDELRARALKSAEGVLLDAAFELVPLLSSPCDLYSLGVLAVRLLLVDPRTTLPAAVDAVLSLARQLQAERRDDSPLGGRIKGLFDRDLRWMDALGPHRLIGEEMTPQEALDLVPMALWQDVLACVIRTLPSMGDDSVCRDWSDAPPGGIHRVLDQARHDLEDLVLRSRSLVVVDWRLNREIHAAVRSLSPVVQ